MHCLLSTEGDGGQKENRRQMRKIAADREKLLATQKQIA
jgi:hypothetical protein